MFVVNRLGYAIRLTTLGKTF